MVSSGFQKLSNGIDLFSSAMAKDSCIARITAGVAVGAVYGTYEAIRYKVPGFMKIRHVGQTTITSAAIFGLFLGAGSLIRCGKSS